MDYGGIISTVLMYTALWGCSPWEPQGDRDLFSGLDDTLTNACVCWYGTTK